MSQVGLQPVSRHGLYTSSNIEVEILREPLDYPIGAFVERGKGFTHTPLPNVDKNCLLKRPRIRGFTAQPC
jgi:hypothetical protein